MTSLPRIFFLGKDDTDLQYIYEINSRILPYINEYAITSKKNDATRGTRLESLIEFWSGLVDNEYITPLIENNTRNNNWYSCPVRMDIGFFLKNAIFGVNMEELSGNPNALRILKNNIDNIDWSMLSGNKNAIQLLEKNVDKVDWYRLSMNENAIPLLEKNVDKINWKTLSKNKNAIQLLEQHMEHSTLR